MKSTFSLLYRCFAVSTVTVFMTVSAQAAGDYEIYDVTPSYSTYTHAYAFDLNENNEAVGHLSNSFTSDQGAVTSGFLYSAGTWTNLDGPNGLDSAQGINETGQIAGYGIPAGKYDPHAYIYSGGTATDIGNLAGNNPNGVAAAYDINDLGTAVGYSETSSGWFHAFKYQSGTMTDLAAGSGYINSVSMATAINNSGTVVGSIINYPNSTAFIWHATGGMVTFSNLTQAYSEAHDINDMEYVVGFAKDSPTGNSHAFVCLGATGAPVLLDTLPGGTWSEAYGINNNMQIVGSSNNQAVLWEQSSPGIYDTINLNDLLPEDSLWTLIAAYAINDTGSIVGYGTITGQTGYHAFLLKANYEVIVVPEPLSAVLLLGALAGIIIKKQRAN